LGVRIPPGALQKARIYWESGRFPPTVANISLPVVVYTVVYTYTQSMETTEQIVAIPMIYITSESGRQWQTEDADAAAMLVAECGFTYTDTPTK